MPCQLSIFKQCRVIGIVWPGGRRRGGKSIPHGMDCIANGSSFNFEPTGIHSINDYQYVAMPIMSVDDVLWMMDNRELLMNRDCSIVAGGAGAINCQSYIDMVDVVNIGRCDDLFDEIVDGYRDDSTWTHDSPATIVRQATRLYEGEVTLGCPKSCKFCQYAHVRKPWGGSYHHGNDLTTPELTFDELDPREIKGWTTTAWDGLSEQTRMRVNKKISDDMIEDTLRKIILNLEGTAMLKVFNIVGYPWETEESVADDIARLGVTMAKSDPGRGGRLFVMLLFTPFSPEPLTPMANLAPNTSVYWGDVFNDVGRNIYSSPNLEVMILPQVNSPHKLLLRVMINRGAPRDLIVQIMNQRKDRDATWPDFMDRLASRYNISKYIGPAEKDLSMKTWKPINYFPSHARSDA